MWHERFYYYAGNIGTGAAILLLAAYFLPTIVAAWRRHLSAGAIFVLNLVFGWTFVGWIFALIWSLTSNTARNRGAR